VYQRAAAGRSSAHRFIVLIPRSMVFLSSSSVGAQKMPATSGKTGSNAGLGSLPGLPEIEDERFPAMLPDVNDRSAVATSARATETHNLRAWRSTTGRSPAETYSEWISRPMR
jgi:hypothetical protein